MNDPTTPPVPPAAPATDAAPPPKPKKRPGPIRKAAVVLLLILAVLVILAFPFVIEPWAVSTLRSSLAARNLHLNDDAKLDLSVFGGRLSGENLHLTELVDGKPNEVLAAGKLDADIAVMDSLAKFDLILDQVTITDASGSLRRRSDGTIPILPPPADGEGTDWSKVDWWKYYQKLSDYLKQRKEEQQRQEEEAKKHPEQRPDPTAEPALDWPKATRYKPAPIPGQRGPRVLIRKLAITGKSLGLPDQTPFDVTEFQVDGTDVCLTQDPGETMALTAKVKTTGAGPLDLDFKRLPGDDGTFTLKAAELPLAALADPKISGDSLAKYGATGTANLNFTSDWKSWDMTGAMTSVVTGLKLAPQAGAGNEVQQAAQVINRMDGKPLTWPMKLGGTLYAPTVTDTGLQQVLKGGVTDAVKGVVGDKAQQEMDKQLDKNPQLKDAKDKASGLLKGFGK